MHRTVVFIHDAWLSPGVWRHFADRFAACGYTWMAPAWPGIETSAPEHKHPDHIATRQPPAGLVELGMDGLLAHYAFLIRTLVEPPVLVGHGVGGLLVQLLIDRGLGAVGIAIAPTPPSGVLPGWSALRRIAPLWSSWSSRLCMRVMHRTMKTSPAASASTGVARHPAVPASFSPSFCPAIPLTRARFDHDVAQTLPLEQRQQAFDDWVVPASGRLLWQTLLGIGCKVDFGNDCRAPLLFIAGEQDRSVQASTVAASFRQHRRSVAVSAMRLYAGRSHLLITEPGWEEIADACIDWANQQLGGF
ncbi:alpha/beta hydrolase [Pigmentiphaga aceris]|uniref:Alpha/beta hydrolase n=1 Tax=Pigmentiphaga aceris TaxID=1940612 RepID=A0A5C0B342_9BURK|nr:alpha/beta hydrolase [Pigmentiphaga aceris]QEI09012.1 alpha/beta hydrolase [Pigmentiphaga aceris]